MHAKQLRQGILIGVLLLVAFWLLSLIWGLAGKARVAVEEAHTVERQYQALEERKAVLEANLAALSTARGQGCGHAHGIRRCATGRRGYRGGAALAGDYDATGVLVAEDSELVPVKSDFTC